MAPFETCPESGQVQDYCFALVEGGVLNKASWNLVIKWHPGTRTRGIVTVGAESNHSAAQASYFTNNVQSSNSSCDLIMLRLILCWCFQAALPGQSTFWTLIEAPSSSLPTSSWHSVVGSEAGTVNGCENLCVG